MGPVRQVLVQALHMPAQARHADLVQLVRSCHHRVRCVVTVCLYAPRMAKHSAPSAGAVSRALKA